VDEPFLPLAGDLERTIERATELMGGEPERERVRGFMGRLEKLRQEHDRTRPCTPRSWRICAPTPPRGGLQRAAHPRGQSPAPRCSRSTSGSSPARTPPDSPEVTLPDMPTKIKIESLGFTAPKR
jgi:hypothetical protein